MNYRLLSIAGAAGDEECNQQLIEVTNPHAPWRFITQDPGEPRIRQRELVKQIVRSHVSRGTHRQRRENQKRKPQQYNLAKVMKKILTVKGAGNSTENRQTQLSMRVALSYKDNREFYLSNHITDFDIYSHSAVLSCN
jgi:hypothetical protein